MAFLGPFGTPKLPKMFPKDLKQAHGQHLSLGHANAGTVCVVSNVLGRRITHYLGRFVTPHGVHTASHTNIKKHGIYIFIRLVCWIFVKRNDMPQVCVVFHTVHMTMRRRIKLGGLRSGTGLEPYLGSLGGVFGAFLRLSWGLIAAFLGRFDLTF